MPVGQTVARETIEAMAAEIARRFSPERIILFGSQARGDAKPYSDVDLLVIVADGEWRPRLGVDMSRELLRFEVPVDVVVVRRSTVDRRGHICGYVYHEALREGQDLYVADRI